MFYFEVPKPKNEIHFTTEEGLCRKKPDCPYLTCGVPQEVTYVGNNFTEGQALSSISERQEF